MNGLSRRAVLGGSLGLAAAAVLAGCAPGGGGGSDDPVRFGFWGPAFYQELTRRMTDAFTAASGVAVAVEPTEWSGYWDRLATQIAGGDEPDVINMDGKYLAEYASRGALADLSSLDGLDLSSLSEDDQEAGRVDGTLYAASTGSNAFVVLANPALFEKAGIELPDDTTWTWEDHDRIAAELAGGPVVGTSGGGTYADLTIWLRQHGEDLFGPDGVGYRDDTLAGWFEGFLARQRSGAALSAAGATEDGAAGMEQQAFATGRSAMTWMWTNQLESIRQATGEDGITMLRPPSVDGTAGGNGLFLKASMYWSVAARSKAQDGAARLVDFLLDDPAAAKIQLCSRGVPSSATVLESIAGDLGPSDTDVVAFLDTVRPELGGAPALQPAGASDSQAAIARMLTEVRFERMTPSSAAQQLSGEIRTMIESAR